MGVGGGHPPVGHSQFVPMNPDLHEHTLRLTQGPEFATTQEEGQGTARKLKAAPTGEVQTLYSLLEGRKPY